jgi:hypothetical protein
MSKKTKRTKEKIKYYKNLSKTLKKYEGGDASNTQISNVANNQISNVANLANNQISNAANVANTQISNIGNSLDAKNAKISDVVNDIFKNPENFGESIKNFRESITNNPENQKIIGEIAKAVAPSITPITEVLKTEGQELAKQAGVTARNVFINTITGPFAGIVNDMKQLWMFGNKFRDSSKNVLNAVDNATNIIDKNLVVASANISQRVDNSVNQFQNTNLPKTNINQEKKPSTAALGGSNKTKRNLLLKRNSKSKRVRFAI